MFDAGVAYHLFQWSYLKINMPVPGTQHLRAPTRNGLARLNLNR